MRELSLVDSQDALTEVATAIAGTGLVAIDTEFVRERTYFPELCLVQVATGDLVACVDCLADFDTGPFFSALLRPGCTWVLHSARQDLEVIWNLTDQLPSALIDTQVAAALIGNPPQQSLQAMLAAILGIEISKDQTRTDWSRRPLPAAALRYAMDDVRYLLPAWDALESRLAASGRLEWLVEDCARLLETPPVSDPDTVFDRLKGTGRLDPTEQAIALALVDWRESEARQRNRPRRWILADDLLLAVARARPRNVAELGAIAGLPRKLAGRSGTAIVAAITAAADGALPSTIRRRLQAEQPDKRRVQALQAQVRKQAEALGIAPELIATRRDLAALATGNTPLPLRDGWRAGILRAAG